MEPDCDTFLVAVYTEVDTLLTTELAAPPAVRPGPCPLMADSEVLTLVLIGQWRGSSERALLRWADAHLRPYFPVLLIRNPGRQSEDTGGIKKEVPPCPAV